MALDAALESPPTANRNNFSGSVGYSFVPARNLSITAMGRCIGSSFANNHKVILWTSAGVKLGEVTVTPSSPVENGWAYEMLGSPIALTSGTTYVIGVTETSGGDNWKDLALLTGVDTAFMNGGQSRFVASPDAYPSSTSGAGAQGYAWPNLYEGSPAAGGIVPQRMHLTRMMGA